MSIRYLGADERFRVLAAELGQELSTEEATFRLGHVTRIQRQAVLLLTALRTAYVSLVSLAKANPASIIGPVLAARKLCPGAKITIDLGLALGFAGAGRLSGPR